MSTLKHHVETFLQKHTSDLENLELQISEINPYYIVMHDGCHSISVVFEQESFKDKSLIGMTSIKILKGRLELMQLEC